MHDSERYRCNAADCLLAARRAREPHYQRLYRLMAQSWLSLAYQDDATDDLLASWGLPDLIKAETIVLPFPASPTPSPIDHSRSITSAFVACALKRIALSSAPRRGGRAPHPEHPSSKSIAQPKELDTPCSNLLRQTFAGCS
jgi:hypothetical protein